MKHANPSELLPPPGYTHVVEVTAGRTIYISGQVALDARGALVGANDFAAQTRQVFENLARALASANATFDHVAKITVFVTTIDHLQVFREIRNQYVGARPPASSLMQVTQLFRPDLLIEIEAIAVVEG